jgi:hypothetical protein
MKIWLNCCRTNAGIRCGGEKLANLKTESGARRDGLQPSERRLRPRNARARKNVAGEAEKRQTETRANLDYTRRRETQLAEELNRLTEIRRAMQAEFQEKNDWRKIGEATNFIRDT